MPNYKLIYQVLERKHPEIAKEVFFVQREMDKYEVLKVFTIFCKLKGVQYLKIGRERADLRDMLIAVMTMLYDPEYFMVEKKLRTGLRDVVAALVGNKGGGVSLSYNFKDVKHYLCIYKDFREEAERIYEVIKTELDGKEEKKYKPES